MITVNLHKGADTVNGVENLKVVATLTNTGDEALKILNDPLSPLSTLPAETFSITNEKGQSPEFVGIRAKYVPEVAIAVGDEAVTKLAPGESVSFEHDCT